MSADMVAFSFLAGICSGVVLCLLAHWLSSYVDREARPLPGVDVSESDWATFEAARRQP